jgi:osmotically-inducible protein OsmY
MRRGGRASRGPKGYTRSDERIHEEVCERIARSGVAADEVEVRVENREVTLTGTVHDRREKWWLEDLTDDVFGVEEVHNHLRVARPEPGARGEGGGVRH